MQLFSTAVKGEAVVLASLFVMWSILEWEKAYQKGNENGWKNQLGSGSGGRRRGNDGVR